MQILVGIVVHVAIRVRKLAFSDPDAMVSRTTVPAAQPVWAYCGIVIPSLLQDLVTLTWQEALEVESKCFPGMRQFVELVMGRGGRVEDPGR